jgi:hypothetical protein
MRPARPSSALPTATAATLLDWGFTQNPAAAVATL